MKGSECRLVEYVEGNKKRFVIPVYQRNYDWELANCKKMYDDLVNVIVHNRRSHFFGTISSVITTDGISTEFLVIDGQQRLTTLSLLFLAMRNLLNAGIIKSEDPTLAERITEVYLIDKWAMPFEKQVKLRPVNFDRRAYHALYCPEEDYIRESSITQNYMYFYNRIQKQEITVDQLFEAICRLEIIGVMVQEWDDPQLIFESLNSTGLALSEGDKIRNFVLMGLPTSYQERFYNNYWVKIENCCLRDVTSFVRDYLSVKMQSTPAFSKIYFTFKDYVLGMEETDTVKRTETLLEDMLAYARNYQILLCGFDADVLKDTPSRRALSACINRLNRLETTVTRPFFMEVLRLWKELKLSDADVTTIFMITESYLFRRTMVDLPTNALNKIFLTLHKDIMRLDGNEQEYIAKFIYVLLSKRERSRFPADDEFIAAFSTRQVYHMNPKNRVYILERFENADTLEDKDIYGHVDDGTYSIEHIMPQHLTPTWISELGIDYEQIHEEWLHRIANLTLTAYNSQYSNSSFHDKKTSPHGFANSGIKINTYIAGKEHWTLAELEDRSEHLMAQALQIWSCPTTTYAPAVKEQDSASLDDDIELTGKLISRFSYKNTEQPVTTWAEMFVSVMRLLHAEDKSILTCLAFTKDDGVELAQYVSSTETGLREAVEVEPGIYVERNTSTSMKMTMLRKFFKAYGVDPAELVFYLRDENESTETEEAHRHDVRRRFWDFALPIIIKAHEETGCFGGNHGTKMNWVNGYFGIRGIHLCVIANQDQARIEFYLERSKEENKQLFDRLKGRQSEIETAYEKPLIWDRGDDKKTSRVYTVLEGVSIFKETDWLQMANYMAEWSRKMYVVFVPIMKEILAQ